MITWFLFNQLIASITGGDEKKVGYYLGIMVRLNCCSNPGHPMNLLLLFPQDFSRQLVSLLAVMFWSRLSDHIDRKPILLLGTFALAVSMTCFGLSPVFWGLVVR